MGEAKLRGEVTALMGQARDAREMVDLIDELICERIAQAHRSAGICWEYKDDEKTELLKRAITDYLLQTDPRPGIYVKDKVPIYGPPRKG
jgi:hypothetical protein